MSPVLNSIERITQGHSRKLASHWQGVVKLEFSLLVGVTTSTCKGLFELIYPFVDIAYFVCFLLLLCWSPLLAITLPSPCHPGLLPVYTILLSSLVLSF